MNTDDHTRYVTMAIPEPVVPAVYQLVADYLSGDEPESASRTEGVDEPELGRSADWSIEQLKMLTESSYTIVQRLVDVMDCLAEDPNGWVPSHELAERTELTRGQFNVIWNKLTRHLRMHYEGAPWPVEGVWGPHMGLPLSQVYWRVSPVQAERWQQVRSDG